jgi:CheY-like chemotaxis protein
MQRETVWLVEDEQGIADTLVYMLQQEGFAVEVFERGLPVLDKARKQGPDVMILDVGLPDISGFELCRQLLAAQCKAANIRQTNIENHDVGSLLASFIQHRQASLKDLDGKTFLLQHVDQRVGYPLLIFH